MAVKSIKHRRSAEQTLNQIKALLDRIDPDITYPQWVRVLMVIFYETADSDAGFQLADEWCSKGSKYRGTADVRSTWSYFNAKHRKPVRMGTLIWIANKQG